MIYNSEYEAEIASFVGNSCIEEFKGKSFLISGATGLIGSYLVDALLFDPGLNIKVFALVRDREKALKRFSKHQNNKNLEIVVCDLTQKIEFSKHTDYVIHLASFSDALNYAKYPVETMTVNFDGCKNLLDVATNINAEKFFFASSSEIYGTSEEPMVETNCGSVNSLDIRSCYNESKRAAETLCIAYSRKFGLNVVIGRFCRIYGPTMLPNDSKALSQFIKNSLDQQDIVLKSKGEQKFSYLYVSDAVEGMLVCLLKGESENAYNISEDKNILKLHEIAEYVASLSSRHVIFDLPSEQEKIGFSRVQNSILINEKIKKFGFTPKISIYDGIKRTITLLKSFEK